MPFSNLYGLYQDPGQAAAQYTNQIPGETQQFNQPYMDSGNQAMQSLNPSVTQGLQNPGQFQNNMNKDYTQSPGYQFALDQALQGAENAAAAGGMAGSPMHRQQNMQMASDMASRDYNTWADRNTNLYGMNMGSANQAADRGQRSGQSQAEMISRSLVQQGQYAYDNSSTHNMMMNAVLSNLASIAGFADFS